MAEYIDKELVIDTIEELKSKALPKALLFDHLKKVIEIFPTEDFAPVRHGRWTITEILCGIGKKRKYYRCSECYKTNVIRSNFCPNCGAKMDGGEDNG